MPRLSGWCSTLIRPSKPVSCRDTRASTAAGSPPSFTTTRCQSVCVCASTLPSARASSTGRSRVRISTATRDPSGPGTTLRRLSGWGG